MLAPALLLAASEILAQSGTFEVAAIKPAASTTGRFFRMESAHRFFAKAYTVEQLIAVSYNINPHAISGGPSWIESEKYDILAGTPGERRPTLDEQMAMVRNLLKDRFQLAFHRDEKELSIYTLTVVKNGSKLKESTAPPDALPELINTVYPDHLKLPARCATMAQFAAMLQRAVLDLPVVDKTGLTAKYDFELEWTPDETQFGGQLPKMTGAGDAAKPSLVTALREQLGLRLQTTRGPVQTIVIDHVAHPSEN